ncbi:hypothetical protein Hanom_Chr05g00434601 [Helianthus anomalus]
MIASKTLELSVFHPKTGTEISFKKADVVILDDSTKHKEVLDSSEVALDDAETRAMVGNPTQFTSFKYIFNVYIHT